MNYIIVVVYKQPHHLSIIVYLEIESSAIITKYLGLHHHQLQRKLLGL